MLNTPDFVLVFVLLVIIKSASICLLIFLDRLYCLGSGSHIVLWCRFGPKSEMGFVRCQ